MPSPYALLYVSHLAATTPVTAVPALFAAARSRHQANGVTGVMAFDGAGFCHYLEGERARVIECLEQDRADARQADVKALYQDRCLQRRYTRFVNGYASSDDLPASEQLRELSGGVAFRRFLQMLPSLDLEG